MFCKGSFVNKKVCLASIKKEKLRLNEGKLETVIYHKLSDVDFVHLSWREKWPDFFPLSQRVEQSD